MTNHKWLVSLQNLFWNLLALRFWFLSMIQVLCTKRFFLFLRLYLFVMVGETNVTERRMNKLALKLSRTRDLKGSH
jgi:hypothetical protein